MSNRFASTQKAIGECDICGFRFKLRELRNIITRGRDTNTKAERKYTQALSLIN